MNITQSCCHTTNFSYLSLSLLFFFIMIPVSEHDIFTQIVRVAPKSSVVILKKKRTLASLFIYTKIKHYYFIFFTLLKTSHRREKYMKYKINWLKLYLLFLATDADSFLMHFWRAGVPVQSNLTDSLVTGDLWAALWNLIAV